jgi:hypothetical protein
VGASLWLVQGSLCSPFYALELLIGSQEGGEWIMGHLSNSG